MNRYVAVVLIAAIGFTGCSNPADSEEFDANYVITSDGSSIYAVGNRTDTQSTVAKFDGNSGDMIWSTTIGSTFDSGTIAGGEFLWVVVDEEEGIESRQTDDERDWLLKISLKTGEVIDQIAVDEKSLTPTIEIDGELWLPNTSEASFEVVDIETGELTETIQVNNETFGEFAVSRVEGTPVIIGDDLWLVDGGFPSLARISISKREVIDPIDLGERYDVAPDSSLLPRAEYRDGLILIAERTSRSENTADQFVFSFDPETLELSEPIPHYESPYGTLETEQYTFDQTAENEITQIDNTTGETIQTLEGNNPRYLIGDKLWFDGLTYVTIKT